MPNEQEQFLKELEHDDSNQDPFADIQQPAEPEQEQAESTPEQADLKPRNRRERRLEAKLQAEREASIALAARLEALTEARQARTDESPEGYLKAIERIYGTESPEAREATEILKQALKEVKETAKREALEAYEERSSAEARAVVEAESRLDEMIEEIEEEFDIDLSSKVAEKQRTDFYRLLEKMSPKDKDGNILYYADPIAVWEVYQDRTTTKPNPATKQLAARGMQNSQPASNSNLLNDATLDYLRQHDII